MPIKWSPAVQQQQQPQQHVQMQQYQQQQHDYQQDYQSDYQQEYTPKPDPQMVYQKSLAQSRQQQNEYLAEMQRSELLLLFKEVVFVLGKGVLDRTLLKTKRL